MTDKLDVIILSGGQGSRFGGSLPKTFIKIKNRVLIEYPIFAFRKTDFVDKIILVVGKNAPIELINKTIKEQNITVVQGGLERYDSVYNGLQALANMTTHNRNVAIHDGARAFVPNQVISDTFQACVAYHAAAPGLNVTDTIKQINSNGFIDKHLQRKSLIQIQTPQIFDFDLIWSAYNKCDLSGITDDTQLIEQSGTQVKITQGSRDLFKLTYPEDLILADTVAKRYEF